MGRSKKTPKLRVTGLGEGVHRWPVDSPHKVPVARKMLPSDDVIMISMFQMKWLILCTFWYQRRMRSRERRERKQQRSYRINTITSYLMTFFWVSCHRIWSYRFDEHQTLSATATHTHAFMQTQLCGTGHGKWSLVSRHCMLAVAGGILCDRVKRPIGH